MSKLTFLFPILVGIITYSCTRGSDGQLFEFIITFMIALLILSVFILFHKILTIKKLCLMYSLSVLLSLPSFVYSNLDGMAGMLPLLIVACIASGFILNLIQIFILNRINQKNITTQ